MMKVMITGANGHLGLKLLAALNETGQHEAVALVRSESAASKIRQAGLKADIHLVDYADEAALQSAAQGCQAVVHLVGIIKESSGNTYHLAHEASCRALANALQTGQLVDNAQARVEKTICVGVLGTAEQTTNRCFQSRYAAEKILLDAETPAIILRVPMVLGEGDYATWALASKARQGWCLSFRSTSLEQPIDSQDLVNAILASLTLPAENLELELAGPESLSRTALIHRAAACLGHKPPRVIALPISLGMALAWLLEKLLPRPAVTPAMLGVLDHDDQIDAQAAAARLGINLTPLDKTLNRVLGMQ